MAKKIERYRKAGDGQYTNEEYAKKHPKTTVKETDNVKPKRQQKKQLIKNLRKRSLLILTNNI